MGNPRVLLRFLFPLEDKGDWLFYIPSEAHDHMTISFSHIFMTLFTLQVHKTGQLIHRYRSGSVKLTK